MTDPLNKNLSYEEITSFAASSDPSIRKAMAERNDVNAEILYYLASDTDSEVRLSVALNPNSPPQIFSLLANDKDENVRKGLASQFATLAPDLDEETLGQIWKVTHNALKVLAQDQAVKVRSAMAEALKGFVMAPQDVIDTLARDIDTIVSSPVLEFSPVLREKDLLDIISKGAVTNNLVAISRRSQVSESISDAIVDANDPMAIAELLGNKSAQIREEVLDTLIDRAPDFEFWHASLVTRPFLPSGAPQRLAMFIADNLVSKLKTRADIDADALKEISNIMQERFNDAGSDDDIRLAGTSIFDFLVLPLPMVRAKRLVATGSLNEAEIMRSMQEDDYLSVLAAFVALTGLGEEVVKRVFRDQNSKAIVSLIWRAGFSPNLMVDLQRRVARLAPNDVIKPKKVSSPKAAVHNSGALEFPLSEKEMEWSIQFVESLVSKDPGSHH
jgi:uncharacterized protein (DUF2336 family)